MFELYRVYIQFELGLKKFSNKLHLKDSNWEFCKDDLAGMLQINLHDFMVHSMHAIFASPIIFIFVAFFFNFFGDAGQGVASGFGSG